MFFVAGAVFLCALATGWLARATIENSATWGTIPYRGHLELDGLGLDTPVDLRVSLWDAPSGGGKLWEETQTAVPTANGEFAIRLGAAAALNAAVETAENLFLEIHVRQTGSSSFEVLAGRQGLGSAPFALAAKRSIPGRTFVVDDLSVTGPAAIAGSTVVSGGLSVDGGVGIGLAPSSGVSLDTAGAARLRGGHVPDFDSGWVAASTQTTNSITLNHGLGALPSSMVIQVSTVNDGSWARIASGSSFGAAGESPESNWVTTTQVQIRLWGGDNLIFCDDQGWTCPSGITTTNNGYIRVLLWK